MLDFSKHANPNSTETHNTGRPKPEFLFGRSRHSLQEEKFRINISAATSQDSSAIELNQPSFQQTTPNVFAQPLFRTKSASKGLSFKDFQKTSIDSVPQNTPSGSKLPNMFSIKPVTAES